MRAPLCPFTLGGTRKRFQKLRSTRGREVLFLASAGRPSPRVHWAAAHPKIRTVARIKRRRGAGAGGGARKAG